MKTGSREYQLSDKPAEYRQIERFGKREVIEEPREWLQIADQTSE